MAKYLVHHIDEGLSIVSAKTPNNLDLFAVGKDIVNQGAPFARSEGAVNQSFPCRYAAECDKDFRLVYTLLRSGDSQTTRDP